MNSGVVNEEAHFLREVLSSSGSLSSQEEELIGVLEFIEKVQKTKEWDNLQAKTQVFNNAYLTNRERKDGEYKVKTRGSHCYDVALIAKSLVEALEPDNILEQYYAYMIGLIHDLGHIAFGHAGESIADSIIRSASMSEEEKKDYVEVRKALFGADYKSSDEICFEHNENSVIQYATMCQRFNIPFSQKVADGILAHSTSRVANDPNELSQQAVRLADKIAYVNYDVQDMITSFQHDSARLDALMSIYGDGLKDPDGNEIKIHAPGFSSDGVSIMEFLGITDSNGQKFDEIKEDKIFERISMMISESVEDARKRNVLTGCQDILVSKKAVNKVIKKAKKELAGLDVNAPDYESKKAAIDAKISQAKEQLKQLDKELFERSELLYCIYQIKDRSDGLIQASVGLNAETKVEMNRQAVSSVGNEDEKNEMIYEELCNAISEYVSGTFKVDKNSKEYETYIKLFSGYNEFKKEQIDTLNNIQKSRGVAEPKKLPEICMIVNYIGTYSNEQLTAMAKDLGIVARFEEKYQRPLFEEMGKAKYYTDDYSLSETGKAKKEELKSDLELDKVIEKAKESLNDISNLIIYFEGINLPFDKEKLVGLKNDLASYLNGPVELLDNNIQDIKALSSKINKEVFLNIQAMTDEKLKRQCMEMVLESREYVSEASFGR